MFSSGYKISFFKGVIIASSFLMALFSGCVNDIEVIQTITSTKTLPEAMAENMEIIYSDSGKVRFKVKAKQLLRYTTVDKPYIEFPKGVEAIIYDSALHEDAYIKANYAIFYEQDKMWIARNAVEAKNLKKGDQLNTEEMFWDQKKKKIYSKKFTRIINPDGVFYGDGGFESNEAVTQWRLIGTKGSVSIKDEKNEQENP